MERVRFLFLSLVFFLSLLQDLRADQPVRDEGLNPAELSLFEENGKVGLKDGDGKVLIPAVYEAIGWSNGTFSIIDHVVGYQINGQWGLITISNKVLTSPDFLSLRPGEGSFFVAEKKSPLSQRPSFGVINSGGKTIIPFIYDGLHLSNMRAVVMSRTGTKYFFGLTDLSHKVLIPIQYQRIYSLGSLRYAVENFDNKTAIFSEEGGQVTPFVIDSISAFRRDYAIVYQDQKQGLIDRNGQMIVKPVYGEVRIDDNTTVFVREIHQWSLLRGDNTLIKQCNVDDLKPLSRQHYAVFAAGKVQLTGNDLTPLHEGFFTSLGEFSKKGIAIYRNGPLAGAISEHGKVVVPAKYHVLEPEGDAFRACLDTGGKSRWVILSINGEPITDKQYEYIAPFNGKFYPVKARGYWGALDASGRELITCVHDSLLQESNNNVVVKFKGEYGVISLQEHWLVTPQRNPIKLLNEEAYLEFNDSTTFLKSFKGDLIYFSENPLEYERGYIREKLASGAYWVIDMSGIVIDRSNQPLKTDRVFIESEGLRAIRKDGKFGFIDDAGRLRIANRYEDAQPFSEGLAAIRIRGKWGFIDHQERLVIQPVYDKVEDFDNGVAIVWQDGYCGLIDASGKVVIPVRYDEVTRNEHKRYVIRSGSFSGLADASGAIIIHPKYDDIHDTGNGYVIVERNGRFGVLTLRGVSTIPMIYDKLTFDRYHDQFLALKKSKLRPLRNDEE